MPTSLDQQQTNIETSGPARLLLPRGDLSLAGTVTAVVPALPGVDAPHLPVAAPASTHRARMSAGTAIATMTAKAAVVTGIVLVALTIGMYIPTLVILAIVLISCPAIASVILRMTVMTASEGRMEPTVKSESVSIILFIPGKTRFAIANQNAAQDSPPPPAHDDLDVAE